MRRSSVIFIFLLTSFHLWITIPRTVFAQEISPTPVLFTPSATETEPLPPVFRASNGIIEPNNGAILSGTVPISGTANAAWALAFSYAENLSETWFPLAQSGDPVFNEILVSWETNNLTDGYYLLRLSIFAVDGKQDFVTQVNVNNGTPIETAIPTPMLTLETNSTSISLTMTPSFPTISATNTIIATDIVNSTDIVSDQVTLIPRNSPTDHPLLLKNPAILDPKEILINLGKGILAVVFVYALVGLIFFVRRK